MTTLHLHVHLASSRDEVWAVVGDFGRLDVWHPFVPNCRLDADGVTRIIEAGGTRVIEVMDPDATVPDAHTYTIERSPMPVVGYRATLSVFDEGPLGCTVSYQSSFSTPPGVPEPVIRGLLWFFFWTAFKGLEQRFGGRR